MTTQRGRWAQYKAATDAVVSWLQHASKKKTKKKTMTTTMAPWTLRQIWAAAVYVADNKLPVPRQVLVNLSISIRLRWLAMQCLPPDVGHASFLDLLRAVRAKLAPLVPTATPRPTVTRRPTATPSSGSVSNAFATLSLDDNNDDDDEGAMPPFDKAAFMPPVDGTPEDEARAASLAQMEADQFRVVCFVMDMDGLMGDVKTAWAAFKQGTTTLVAATAVTNHCVRAVEVLANELAIEYPYLTTLDDIDIALCNGGLLQHTLRGSRSSYSLESFVKSTACIERALTAIDPSDAQFQSMLRDVLEAGADLIASLPKASSPETPWSSSFNLSWTSHLQCLLGLQRSLVHIAPLLTPGAKIEATFPHTKWHETTTPATSTADLTLEFLINILSPLLLSLHSHTCRWDTYDTFMPYVTHLEAFAKTKVPSIPFVFATECLLASVLAVQGPPSDTVTCAKVASSTLESLKQVYRGMLRAHERRRRFRIRPSVDSCMTNMTLWLRLTLAMISNTAAYKRAWQSPWMVGQLLLITTMAAQVDAGCCILDDVHQTKSMLHLYNALRVVGRLPPVPELDVLLQLIGGYPTTPGRFVTSIVLALGCEAKYARALGKPGLVGDLARRLELCDEANGHRTTKRLCKKTAIPLVGFRKMPKLTPHRLSRAFRLATYAEQPTSLADLQRTLDDEWHSSFLRLNLWVVNSVFCEMWAALTTEAAPYIEAALAKPDVTMADKALLMYDGKPTTLAVDDVRPHGIVRWLLGLCDTSPNAASLDGVADIFLQHIPMLRDASVALGP